MTLNVILTAGSEDEQSTTENRLRLKGQMKYVTSWESVVLLGTPM